MQDLRSKLDMYKSNKERKTPSSKVMGPDVHDLLGGSVCRNEAGEYLVLEKRFPCSYVHGGCRLADVLGIDAPVFGKLCCELKSNIEIKDFLFLDTETTGLSGGAGTVAFLTGVGFFEPLNYEFVLRQYFMRDYNEEPAVLMALNELLGLFKGLITFNGKAFDWNLLLSRFTFNRMRPSMKQPVHMDLLYPSRKIWKAKLESCRLSSLEEGVLGEGRHDDIPGIMIPSIYFKYLEDRNAGEISKVIKHNELDILSMAALLARISLMLANPLRESDGAYELLGVGRIFEAHGEYNAVLNCFEGCIKSGNVPVKHTAAIRLSEIYKKNCNYDKAVEYWKSMLDDPEVPGMYPLIELAKYYEHKLKNISKALEMAEKAMKLSLQTGLGDNIYLEDLKKRMERLKRKTNRV